jgi:hypothetical protein
MCPEGFKEWVEKNKERIAAAEMRGTSPWFLRENKKLCTFGGFYREGFAKTNH